MTYDECVAVIKQKGKWLVLKDGIGKTVVDLIIQGKSQKEIAEAIDREEKKVYDYAWMYATKLKGAVPKVTVTKTVATTSTASKKDAISKEIEAVKATLSDGTVDILNDAEFSKVKEKIAKLTDAYKSAVKEEEEIKVAALAAKVQKVADEADTGTNEQTADESDLSQYIPSKNGYIPRKIFGTTDVEILKSLYENRNNQTIVKHYPLLIGETGSGKTHLARNLAYVLQKPYMRVNMNGATTPEDLVGQYIPNKNPNSKAKYVWQDGVLTKFMRYGGLFVVDEINMCPADILSIMHSVTDDEKRLVLTQKDGEVIHAAKDFFLIATMNPDYEGTKPLNTALKDRFKIMFVDYDKAVEKKLGIDAKMIDIAERLRYSDEIATPVGTRDLIDYQGNLTLFGSEIARAYFINNFEENERPVVKEIIEMVLDGKEVPAKNDVTTDGVM